MFHLLQIISFIIIVVDELVVMTSAYCLGSSSICPNGVEVNYPFWIEDVMDYCGYPGFSVKCTNEEGRAVMNISNNLYYVQNIDYARKSFRVVDADIDKQECPQPRQNFQIQDFLHYDEFDRFITFYYNCSTRPKNTSVPLIPCFENYYNSKSGRGSCAFLDGEIPKGFDLYGHCEESVVVPVFGYYDPSKGSNYTQALKLGFDLSWSMPKDDVCYDCEHSGGRCWSDKAQGGFRCLCTEMDSIKLFNRSCPRTKRSQGIPTGLKVIIGVFTGIGALLLILLFVYRKTYFSVYYLVISHWKNKIKSPTNLEVFLENYGFLALQRYKYSDVKKMTNSFKDTLGQGGYGCVFKGKLPDGRLVAVKVLNVTKGNGEDFINEVTTIGRTNHVNVVSLLGFCTEGSKRALVYEFMPNGSLERFIYNVKDSSTGGPPLGWAKLYEIALGIARGLEYLHRGCNTRILHFDIKPHNILLDQDFCPKISDFGLAKLCPTKESVVSMLVARGTIGYIAPEVYCRNFGGVSHKSDVYSYGMLVLEMIGGRRNMNATMENSSEIYFPQWIYNHFNQDIQVEESGEIYKEETTKKMITVALWCIQTQPADRPSITKVVEILEGNTEELQMPPNPFQRPPSMYSPYSS